MAHSEELKATAMALFVAERGMAPSDNAAAIRVVKLLKAQSHSVAINSVVRWARSVNINEDTTKKSGEKKLELSALFEDSMRRVFEHGMTDEKIKAASFRDISVYLGIAAEKHQLLTGQPTSIEAQQGSLWDHINSVSKNGK